MCINMRHTNDFKLVFITFNKLNLCATFRSKSLYKKTRFRLNPFLYNSRFTLNEST